jgi:hypothetical protein
MSKKSEKSERKEALMRIVVGIVSGIIFYFWTYVIVAFMVVNFFYTLIKGNRSKDLANLCEIYNSQVYSFYKYMTFVSNQRPFPFESLAKNISKFE